MLEVEVKYRSDDWEAVRATLSSWGAAVGELREDADHYFNAPDRDFARTDEALRIRQTGPATILTYKGPKRDAQTKTRTEIELPLAPRTASTAATLLTSLGYRPVAVVTKRRQVYRFTRDGFACEACLDDVGPLGRFVELEIQAEECDYETAKSVLLATAAALGLHVPERRSYLELLLQKNQS